MLGGIERHDAVDAALELHAARKAQRVAHVDKGAAGLGRHEAHLSRAAGTGRANLQTPLLAEEEGEGADVGVLLVPDAVLAGEFGGEVVHHGQLGTATV